MIVDDEDVEREGIKFLINKHGLPLDIIEEENGEDALEYLKSNPVDILFTDIKMPFMDGIDLSEKVRELYPNIKIIIFSAYGEFDYAKRAINANVSHYILKPIHIDEFIKVFKKIIELCDKECEEKEQNQQLFKVYNKAIEFEKEKIFIELINGAELNADFINRMELGGVHLKDQFLQLIMVDFRSKFFDKYNDDFRKNLLDLIKNDYFYINLNERQSVIFLIDTQKHEDNRVVMEFAEALKKMVVDNYNTPITIVISEVIDSIEWIGSEFNFIETMLDSKFFFDDSIILFAHGIVPEESLQTVNMEKLVDNIFTYIDITDFYSLEKSIDLFFDKLKGQENFSVIYIKFTCSEIIKRVIEKLDKEHTINLKFYIEEIFKSETYQQMKKPLESIITAMKTVSKTNFYEVNKKVIKDIFTLIERNYMNDISLEWIAEKVFLSPGYLSYYFKKETGQSLVKYITSYRLQNAWNLLQNTNMKIVDVSEKVGYNNTSYFCLNFKDHFGISPTQCRIKDE